jgi:hypothetical protein
MKSYIKIASLSLAVLFGISTGSFAKGECEFDPWSSENLGKSMMATGQHLSESQSDLTLSGILNQSTVEKDEQKASALSIFGGYAAAGAGWLKDGLLNMGVEGAKNTARWAVAYNASYLSVEILKEATALGMYYGFYAAGALTIAGPGTGLAAGLAAYNLTKMTFTALNYITPGMDGAIAGFYTPVVKSLTDKAIDYTPAALRTGASLVQTGASTLAAMGSSFASYFSKPSFSYAFGG